jgi:hypothetical protein
MATLSERKQTVKLFFIIMSCLEILVYFFDKWVIGAYGIVYPALFIFAWILTSFSIIYTYWKELRFRLRSAVWGMPLLIVVVVALLLGLRAPISTAMFLIFLFFVIARNWLSTIMINSMLKDEGESS